MRFSNTSRKKLRREEFNDGAPANLHPPQASAERLDVLFTGFAFHTQHRVPVAELYWALYHQRNMKARRAIEVCLLWFTLVGTAIGQGFINLDFEQAAIAPTPVGQFGEASADPALAFPGWTMGPSGALNSNNFTLYNNLTLGSVAQVLVGPNYPDAIGYAPLQGSYSALLQFGPSPTLGTPALIQTGVVTANTRSITFLVSATQNDARVTLDGMDIPLIAIGGGRLAGDVTAFAGGQAELMFSTTSYNGTWLYFDDVVFSPTAVPEPSILGLISLGVVALPLPQNEAVNRQQAAARLGSPPSPRYGVTGRTVRESCDTTVAVAGCFWRRSPTYIGRWVPHYEDLS